ncbi:MAG: ATP phosphoribosyltransferase, partial [Thermodesulfobacteriota bacterium]|nr:ATP phosphoribosyltransferase [Thermodesulfobacteriota bacterium]
KELMETNTQLIANRMAWRDEWKKNKIKNIALMLQGALRAEALVALKMNVPRNKVEKIIEILPSLNAPTVANLHQSDWVSVESVVAGSAVRDLIPEMIKRGAEGIIEYPLNKVF